ncbi:MAG: DMT family transporter [Gammaproteobacteria bacterium]
MKYWGFLLVAIIAEVIGTAFLRQSEGFSKLAPSLAVVVGFGLSFYFLSLTLKVIPVGIAYAVWSGLGLVLISLIGWKVFGEKLGAASLLGIALILAGVIILHFSTKTPPH